MRLQNDALVPAEALQSISRFLSKRFPQHKAVRVILTGTPDPQFPTAAFITADAYPNGGWNSGVAERHLIQVYVPTLKRPYPTTQQNPAKNRDGIECPVITFDSWEDELVAVLAHELRHVEQFEAVDPKEVVVDQDGRYEVEAEYCAFGVLSAWRESANRRKCWGCDKPAAGPHRFSCSRAGKNAISLPAVKQEDGTFRVVLPQP